MGCLTVQPPWPLCPHFRGTRWGGLTATLPPHPSAQAPFLPRLPSRQARVEVPARGLSALPLGARALGHVTAADRRVPWQPAEPRGWPLRGKWTPFLAPLAAQHLLGSTHGGDPGQMIHPNPPLRSPGRQSKPRQGGGWGLRMGVRSQRTPIAPPQEWMQKTPAWPLPRAVSELSLGCGRLSSRGERMA